MAKASLLLEEGRGVLRLKPAWVPRALFRPGRRLKLHPEDYYALGLERGGIDERWLASAVRADNGPGTPSDEGLSYAVSADGRESALLAEAVEELGGELVGEAVWRQYGGLPIFSKYFDNMGPLPHHLHQDDAHAAQVGLKGKPEMYFYPAQMNCHGGEFPFTFFGVNPGVSRETIRRCLADFPKGDNRILDYARAYKLRLDTGFDVPTGVLHAPGSLCTYEPQFASDVFVMVQSVLMNGQALPERVLWNNSPPERVGDVDYVMELIDWEINTAPDFYEKRFMSPICIRDDAACTEEWICYKNPTVGAKRFTVKPGQKAFLRDTEAYGFILVQGHGRCGVWELETPTLIRYGALTNDEFFVSAKAAGEGLWFENTSPSEDLVLLRHFAIQGGVPKL